MGVYIEGLDRPRGEYMRIHIDFDGEVWVFRGSEWKSLGIKATNLDLVRCGECKWWESAKNGWNGWCRKQIDAYATFYAEDFCSYGERRENL